MADFENQFFAACQTGNEGLVRSMLLERPTLISARDTSDNATGLHFAAANGHIGCMRALLDAGADAQASGDAHDGDVIGWAVGDGSHMRLAAVALLIERGARHHIFSAIAMGDPELVCDVAKTDPNALTRRRSKFEQRQTALHFAFSAPNAHAPKSMQHDIGALLVELGADMEATDDLGRTALAVSLMHGDLTAARILVNAGATLPLLGNIPDVDARIAALGSSMYKQVTPMLCVKDVNSAVEWYQSIGFALNEHMPESGTLDWASMSMGHSKIMLQSLVSRKTGEVALWFHSNRIDELYELYKHRHLSAALALLSNPDVAQMQTRFFEDLYSPFYGGRQFSLRDVNGFEVVFYSE